MPQRLPQPTPSELDILRVLWESGPSTVREIQVAVARRREIGYTSVLKFLQIMHGKGLVKRNESKRSHVYEAAFMQERAQRLYFKETLDKVFGGSTRALVLHAFRSRDISDRDLPELHKLLDRLEKRPR